MFPNLGEVLSAPAHVELARADLELVRTKQAADRGAAPNCRNEAEVAKRTAEARAAKRSCCPPSDGDEVDTPSA